ncbi:hypothetical protein [Symbioplanes lichenis]|uniref:hypothetical protein n=1 Tax=Symbioplanes lichenis TaxID=1629072 RepID=UPI002739401E|nr:hypothetical protein [Actinoplanes lichenis]
MPPQSATATISGVTAAALRPMLSAVVCRASHHELDARAGTTAVQARTSRER